MEKQVFEKNGARFLYSFDDLPFKHILFIEEIYHFKRQQIERKASRMEEIISSGGADYKCHAAAYLLLPCDANGDVLEPQVSATRKFVESLKGEDVDRVEECIADFFHRRNLSELESDVRSRVFLTLETLASMGSKILHQNASENGGNALKNSASEETSSDPVNSVDA